MRLLQASTHVHFKRLKNKSNKQYIETLVIDPDILFISASYTVGRGDVTGRGDDNLILVHIVKKLVIILTVFMVKNIYSLDLIESHTNFTLNEVPMPHYKKS